MQIAIVDAGTLARNWWAVVLRGVAGIVFGIFTFVAPGISLAALVAAFPGAKMFSKHAYIEEQTSGINISISRGTVSGIKYLHCFGGHLWLWIESLPNQEGSNCRTTTLTIFTSRSDCWRDDERVIVRR